MRYTFLIIALFLIFFDAIAQENRRLVWESGVALDYKLFDNYRFNTSIANRTSFLENGDQRFTELSFLEINQFVTRKLNPKVKASVGYKYRTVDPVEELGSFEHRITQQLAMSHFESKLRLVSRLRAEQRIRSSTFAQRYRYRLSVDFPLSGEKLDVNEFFIVASSEWLFEAVSSAVNTWENRLTCSLGYTISRNIKADLSMTYRLEDINISTVGVLFLNTGLIVKLN